MAKFKEKISSIANVAQEILSFYLKGFVIIVAYFLSVGQVIFNKNKADEMAGLGNNTLSKILGYVSIASTIIVTSYTRIPAILKGRNKTTIDKNLENLGTVGNVLHKGLFTLNISSGIFASNSTALFARTLLLNIAVPGAVLLAKQFYPHEQNDKALEEQTEKEISEYLPFISIALLFGVARFLQYLSFNMPTGNKNAKLLAKKIEERDFTLDKTSAVSGLITLVSTLPVPLQAYNSTPKALDSLPFALAIWATKALTVTSMVTSATSHFTQSGPTMNRAFVSLVNSIEHRNNPYYKKGNGPHWLNFHDSLFFTATAASAAYDLYTNTIFTNALVQSVFGAEASAATYGVSSVFAVCFAIASFALSREGYYTARGYNIISDASSYIRPLDQDELELGIIATPKPHIPADLIEYEAMEKRRSNLENDAAGTSAQDNEDNAFDMPELNTSSISTSSASRVGMFSGNNPKRNSADFYPITTRPSDNDLGDFVVEVPNNHQAGRRSRCNIM